jgi:hypothetical protein
MSRAPLALLVLAIVVVLAWPVSQTIGAAAGAREPALCREMTAARMLENPALAEEWAAAMRSAEPAEVARIRSRIEEIRAAHGCTGPLAMPPPVRETGPLPPGHPPIDGAGDLPADHPPIPSSPHTPLFQAPAVLSI